MDSFLQNYGSSLKGILSFSFEWFLSITAWAILWALLAIIVSIIGWLLLESLEAINIEFSERLIDKLIKITILVSGIITVPTALLSYSYFSKFSKQESYNNAWVNTSNEIERFKLIELTRPKHVYATFEHVETGKVYSRFYVAKHCNAWSSNKLGDVYNIRYNVYRNTISNEEKIEFESLNSVFC